MTKKSKALTLLFLFLLSLMTGCWSRREIETLAFITALAIDKEEEDILVSVQIAVPQAGGEQAGGGDEPPVWTVKGRGKTIGEAILNITRFVGRAIYMPHVRVIVIGEEFAKAGMGEAIDYFNRQWQLRGTHWFAVAKGKGADILNVQPRLSKMPAFYLNDIFTNTTEYSLTPKITWLEFVKNYSSTAGVQPYAPGLHKFDAEKGRKSQFVSQQENGKEKKIEALSLEQTAVFKGEKLVGWLNDSESRGLLWLQGRVKRSAIVVKNPVGKKGELTKLNTFASSKIKVEPKGDSVEVLITISQEGNLLEQSTNQLFQLPENILKLDKEVAELIKEETNATLDKLQKELNSDIIGITEAIREQQPQIWETKDWEKEFANLDIKVSVTANLRRTGRVLWPTTIKKPWR